MTIRRFGSAVMLLAALFTAPSCGSDDGTESRSTTDGRRSTTDGRSVPSTSPSPSPSASPSPSPSMTVVAPETTIASTTTSTTAGETPPPTTPPAPTTVVTTTVAVAPPESTQPAATSTTVQPPAAALLLRVNGLGNAAFGAEPESVISYVSSVIGPPTADSGWIDPLSLGSCPGTEVRTVTYGDLNLYFGDQSRLAIGRRHFFSYSLGPATNTDAADTPVVSPIGMVTTAAIGVGSTVAELRTAYAALQINPGDQLSGPTFEVSAGLGGLLSGVDDAAVVTALQGGLGCGE